MYFAELSLYDCAGLFFDAAGAHQCRDHRASASDGAENTFCRTDDCSRGGRTAGKIEEDMKKLNLGKWSSGYGWKVAH